MRPALIKYFPPLFDGFFFCPPSTTIVNSTQLCVSFPLKTHLERRSWSVSCACELRSCKHCHGGKAVS